MITCETELGMKHIPCPMRVTWRPWPWTNMYHLISICTKFFPIDYRGYILCRITALDNRLGKLVSYLLMELSFSWESANCAATQELPSILWNPKVHHRVHKSPSLVSVLSEVQSIRSRRISLRFILMLSTCLRLVLSSGFFPSGFPTNIVYIYSSSLLPVSSFLTWSF
jgi:hypothetical protein